MWKGWESARKRPRVLIQKDVTKRVCSRASVGPSSSRLPSLIALRYCQLWGEDGTRLDPTYLFSEGVGRAENKMPAWAQGALRGRV